MRSGARESEERKGGGEREGGAGRLRAIFDAVSQLQLLMAPDGVVLEANRAARELAAGRADAEPLVGRRLWEMPWWDAAEGAAIRERFARARAGERVHVESFFTLRPDRPTSYDLLLLPVPDEAGGVAYVLLEARDLTDRRRAEGSLREIGALSTMGQLAARVAHEINNPLAGIQNAFLLVRGAIPAEHPHYHFVGAIEREIARIAAVTRQLYETYRPDESMSGESSVILAIGDAVSFLSQVNRTRAVRIATDVSRAPTLVPVPDALVRQALYNLVQNAMDATPDGGTVSVSAALDGDECVIAVRDEGPGIPDEIRARIFEPFFSTKNRTVKAGGMGIGLSLIRQSVSAIGGRIAVRDRDGGGTEFEVRLPMTPIDTGIL